MHKNVTFLIGNIVLLDRIQKDYGYFDFLFDKIGGKSKDFQNIVKSLIYNKLTDNVSINQIPNESEINSKSFWNCINDSL